jgi:hypothetical protein
MFCPDVTPYPKFGSKLLLERKDMMRNTFCTFLNAPLGGVVGPNVQQRNLVRDKLCSLVIKRATWRRNL